MCSNDGDAALVWAEREHKARKPYRCAECNHPIPAGAKYTCISGISAERAPFRDRVHSECMALWHLIHTKECGNDGLIEIGSLEIEIENIDEVYTRDANPYRVMLAEIRATYPRPAQCEARA